MVAAEPPELIVYDEPGDCSYLTGRIWRLPLRFPVRPLSRSELGRRLADGDRRQGRLLYRTACPDCCACEPIRIEIAAFHPSRTQRRVLRLGDRRLSIELGPIQVTDDRVELYNKHKHARGLWAGESIASLESYRSFLGESCCDTFEMRYCLGSEVVGLAIVDIAHDALSAVYFYWDPKYATMSLGSYSILKQLELCERLKLRYLYLGLYIADCRPMAYKAAFRPNERLVDNRWQRYE